MNLLGLLFITISIFAGVVKGYCGKNVGSQAENLTDSAKLNSLRMVLCTLISLIVLTAQSGFNSIINVPVFTLVVSALASIATCIFIISWLMAVRGSAYMLVSVFTNLGVIVPITLSAICFGESITLNKIIGILVLLVAIWLMLGYNKTLNGRFTVKDFIMLFVCGVANGLCDFIIGGAGKLTKALGGFFGTTDTAIDFGVFNFYMYVFSFIILLSYTFISSATHHKATVKIDRKILIYMTLMAIFLFVNTYFKTLAGELLTSSQLFSVNTGGSLVLASLMASIMFKEKPNLKSVIGIILTFVSLFILQG